MKRKRWISFILTLVIIASLAVPTSANNGEVEQIIPTDDEVKSYALNFMISSQDDVSLTIRDFIHLTDSQNMPTGYYITFNNNATPAGYVLLSLINGGTPVVEFAFEGSGILNSSDIATYSASKNISGESLIFTGAGELYIPIEDNTYYSVYDRTFQEIDMNISTYNEVDLYKGIVDWSAAGIKSNSVFKIRNIGSGTDYWLMSEISEGQTCSPVTATNILWYWGTKRNCPVIMNKVSDKHSDKDKAKKLCTIMTDTLSTNPDVGTWEWNVENGYKRFFGTGASDGGVWNCIRLANGTSYDSYKSHLGNHCPIHLILQTKDGFFLDKGTGHCVMNFGYAEGTNNAHYLFVMDGTIMDGL